MWLLLGWCFATSSWCVWEIKDQKQPSKRQNTQEFLESTLAQSCLAQQCLNVGQFNSFCKRVLWLWSLRYGAGVWELINLVYEQSYTGGKGKNDKWHISWMKADFITLPYSARICSLSCTGCHTGPNILIYHVPQQNSQHSKKMPARSTDHTSSACLPCHAPQSHTQTCWKT